MSDHEFGRQRKKTNPIIAQHTKRIRDRKKAGTINAEELLEADIYLKALRRKAKPWPDNRVSFFNSVRARLRIFELPHYGIKPEFLDSIAEIAAAEFDAHSQQRKAAKALHKKAALKK
jgi:hypothetical protein